MDRYQKVQSQRSEAGPINENEIRITSQGLIKNYLSYATTLLYEKKGKEIVLKAMGQAISKAVAIAEIIKRKFPRLHQDTAISSVSITDVWEPIEEGLVRVEQTRHVSVISITFSPNALDKNSPGYQAPALVEQQQPSRQGRVIYRPRPQYNNYDQQQPPRQGRVNYHADNEDSYGRGGGHGRGRGRGWSRGGYGNYQENGGYSNSYRGGGRGRNWGYRGYGYEGGNGYERGNEYEGGNGYNRRDWYNGGGNGYYRGGRYERDNEYQRGGARNQRGAGYERDGSYERQRGGGGGGQRGGYGGGRGHMGGRGRDAGF